MSDPQPDPQTEADTGPTGIDPDDPAASPLVGDGKADDENDS